MSERDNRANSYAAKIDECRTSKEAAVLYADALATYGPDGLNWSTVNGAILRRWAKSTLNEIKRQAWLRVQDIQRAALSGKPEGRGNSGQEARSDR